MAKRSGSAALRGAGLLYRSQGSDPGKQLGAGSCSSATEVSSGTLRVCGHPHIAIGDARSGCISVGRVRPLGLEALESEVHGRRVRELSVAGPMGSR